MKDVRLKILSPSDLPWVLAVERASFPDDPWTLENYLDEMERPYSTVLGLFEEGPGAWPAAFPGAGPAAFPAPRFPDGPEPPGPGAGDSAVGAPPDVAAALAVAEAMERASWTRGGRQDRLSRTLSAGAAALRARTGAASAARASAYAVFWILYGETHLLNLAVAPERRGRGLGRAMLRAVTGLSRAKGSGTVLLEVRANNPAAIALYRSEGFRETGRRRGYYQGGRTDAILMNLELAARGAPGGRGGDA